MGAIKKLVFAGGLVLLSSLSMAAPVAVDPGSTFVLKMVKPIELNASVGSVTSAPTTCSSRTIMWSGSASCSASVPAMSNGSTRTLNDTTGKIGSATVSCNAASNAITVSGGSSCTDPVAVGNRPCSAQAVNWGACTASAPARNHGQNSSISDSTAPSTGSATFTCNDSSFVYSSGNCSTAATTCTNKTVNWSVGGNACGALSGVTNDGANKTVSNTASNGNTGNATFSCTASSDTYSLVGSPTCAPPPATACTSQTLGWNVGGTSCASNSGSVNDGVTTTLASTNGNSGSAQFTCNASTNTFSQTGTPTCAVPPPSSCTSQSKTWGTAPSDCAALTGTTTNGASRTISNTASNGNSGSATYVCNAGTNTYTVSGTPTCSQPAPSACTSQTKSWGTAPANCSAVTGATNNSVSKTVANTLNANTGSATYTCNAATDTYTVSGTPTCSAPARTTCSARTVTWVGSRGRSCSASYPESGDGSTIRVDKKNTFFGSDDMIGSANYTCNASTDTLSVSDAKCFLDVVRGSSVGGRLDAAGNSSAFESYGWGANKNGELSDGFGTYVDRLFPSHRQYREYGMGGGGGCDFYGFCWGQNATGQLGTGSTSPTKSDKPLAINWTNESGPLARAVMGGGGGCASTDTNLKQDYTSTFCWGRGTSGQLGNGLMTDQLAIQNTGRYMPYLAGGRSHFCGIEDNGTAYCWGFNGNGQLGDGTRANKSIPTKVNTNLLFIVGSIKSEDDFTCAGVGNADSQDVYCWGAGDRGQIGNATNADSTTPKKVTDGVFLSSLKFQLGSLASGLDVGSKHACAIATDGRLYCWGDNTFGQLGNGTFGGSSNVARVVDASAAVGGTNYTWFDVEVGLNHSCGIVSVQNITSSNKYPMSGLVLCWGNNSVGQLGQGDTINRSIPTFVDF